MNRNSANHLTYYIEQPEPKYNSLDVSMNGSSVSGRDIDKNFYYLEGMDIAEFDVDPNTNILYAVRFSGEKVEVPVSGSGGGAAGRPGKQGPQGIQGIQGANGANGSNGARGPQGEKGVAGERGEQGPKGDTGEQGPVGPMGPAGPAGGETSHNPKYLLLDVSTQTQYNEDSSKFVDGAFNNGQLMSTKYFNYDLMEIESAERRMTSMTFGAWAKEFTDTEMASIQASSEEHPHNMLTEPHMTDYANREDEDDDGFDVSGDYTSFLIILPDTMKLVSMKYSNGDHVTTGLSQLPYNKHYCGGDYKVYTFFCGARSEFSEIMITMDSNN